MASLLWFTVIGWLVIPVINFLVNKLLSYIEFNLSRKLRELELHIVPNLKLILGDITEQIILRGAKDEDKGYGSYLKTLGELEKDVKSALYDAEDVMDLVEYRRIEKKVVGGDGKSIGTTIRSWVLQAIGDCITCGKRTSFVEKLRDLGAKLQLCAQYLNQMLKDLRVRANQYIHQGATGQPSMPDAPASRSAAEFRDGIEQGSATTPSPTPNALPNFAGSATELRGDNQHGSAEEAPTLDAPSNSLLQKTWDCFGFVCSLLHSIYLAVRRLRDWSYEAAGIKNDDDTSTDCLLSIDEIINLRKRIKNIEYIVSKSKKSPLLNKNSSSTPKDSEKESSSCTIKNSAMESSNKQKEIDEMDRIIERKVFGRDKDRANISSMLRLREGPDTYTPSSSTIKPYSVIGIYGITGFGKTTLAQYVCDYEKKAGHFDPIMFIHVGKTFSVGGIFRDMVKQIKQQQPSGNKDPESTKTELKDIDYQAELKEKLKGKCFLLVLDDLWVNADNRRERGILLDVLRVGQSGSRILVTAQKQDAAAALGARHQISIPDLEEEQYLSMFMHCALEVSQVTSTDYERYKAIGRKITKKLRRSPIAAITVGARLKSNNSIDFWETTAKLDVLNETMGALWWSYQQLAVDIRRCFAYCSTFPKAYRLQRDEFVRIWIAQGFVNTRSNATEDLEDIGRSYFDQFLTFSFLQVQGTTFTTHDLLHELAERVSGSDFFRTDLNNGTPRDIPRGVRHLFIETNNVAEIDEKILDMGNLRTLIISEDPYAGPRRSVETNDNLEKLLDHLFTRLTKLRVLIIKLNCYTNHLSVPASIDHMKHLRYLGFHFLDRSLDLILPSTFSKLYHIQIIDIPCEKASCPEDMANLIYLRHISAPLSFPNIGRLTSLQTLRMFRVKEEHGHELKQLMHLNKLRGTLIIQGLGNVGSKAEALEAHLTHKERLRELVLQFEGRNSDPDVQTEVLDGLCPPKDLEELRIESPPTRDAKATAQT